MRLFVAVTNNSWFDQLYAMSQRNAVDEVNFWRPSGQAFRRLAEGELFLFKLHAPSNVIAGGGFFSRAPQLPIALAWSAFGALNGVVSEGALRDVIREIRHEPARDPITCILLNEPFFFDPPNRIPVPEDFKRYNMQGQTYDTGTPAGRALYEQVLDRLARHDLGRGPAQNGILEARYGTPRLVAPRLGQGSFRIGVLENYQRRCAMSGERTVPVLEAAHIRRYSDHGGHDLRNGLALRSDLHKLFDLGYVGVDPDDQTILVSRRIRDEFKNGRDYYGLAGRRLAIPLSPAAAPDPQLLRYHREHVFRD